MSNVPGHLRLLQRSYWLIKLRWVAIAALVVVTFLVVHTLHLHIEELYMYLVAGFLAISNLVYLLLLKRVLTLSGGMKRKIIERIINFQITADLLALTVLVHYSGGIENPVIIFYIFHMVIGSTLLLPRDSYLQTTLAIVLFTGLTLFEYFGVLNHYTLNENISRLLNTDTTYLITALCIFVVASYMVVYMTTSISTQLRKQQEAIRKANIELHNQDNIKNEYVQRVTHDIKGHLAVIRSSLSIVLKGIVHPIDEGNREFVERSQKRTIQLIQFVKELLHLTNLRLNNRFEPEPFSLRDVIERAIKSVIPNAENKNIEVTCEIGEKVDIIEGIRFSIEEAVANLLLNAIKYTPENGKVGLKCVVDKKRVVLTFFDTGVGIPEDEIPKVFEEFFRASNVKQKVKDGTGLGLSLVKQIVDRHEGEIYVKSKIDEGSEFVIRLPIKQIIQQVAK